MLIESGPGRAAVCDPRACQARLRGRTHGGSLYGAPRAWAIMFGRSEAGAGGLPRGQFTGLNLRSRHAADAPMGCFRLKQTFGLCHVAVRNARGGVSRCLAPASRHLTRLTEHRRAASGSPPCAGTMRGMARYIAGASAPRTVQYARSEGRGLWRRTGGCFNCGLLALPIVSVENQPHP